MTNCTHYGIKGQTYTVLGDAIDHGRTDIALLLIAHGADPNVRSHFSKPINLAAAKGNEPVARSLIVHGARIAPKPYGTVSPLEIAITYKQWKMCGLLRSYGAKDVPLAYEAVAHGDVALLKRAVKADPAVLRVTHPRWQSIIHQAVTFDRVDCIKALVALGADLDMQSKDGLSEPPIALACEEGKLEAVKTLAACGAHLEWPVEEAEKENALYYAVSGRNPDVVRFLLDKGLDPNVSRKAITESLTGELGSEGTRMLIARLLVSKGFVPDKKALPDSAIPEDAVWSYLRKYAK